MQPLLVIILLALSAIPVFSQARTASQLEPSTVSNLNVGSPPLGAVRYAIDASQTTGTCVAAGVGQPAGAMAQKLATGWKCSAFAIGGGGGGVTSITGTTNQVITSGPDGAVTLSLPQSIATTSGVTFGSLLTTGSIQSNDTITGTHLFMSQFLRTSEIAAPSVSSAGSARLYMDSTSHLLRVSENGGAYANLIKGSTLTTNILPMGTSASNIGNSFFTQGGDSTNPFFQFGGATSSHIRLRDAGGSLNIQKADGLSRASVTLLDLDASGSGTFGDTITGTHIFTTTGFMRNGEVAAPSVSSAGTARLYADSTSHTYKVSNNGGSFFDLVTQDSSLNASNLGSGTVPTARLGSGTANSSTYLRGDNTWATPPGTGTVTVVSSGNLTSTALVTGGGTQTLQTPAATATMDSSGNISTPGGVTAVEFNGSGSGASIATGSASNTDLAGLLTVGGGGTVSYTFAGSFTSAPVCVLTQNSAVTIVPYFSAKTNTAFTITGDVAAVINYVCVGRDVP